MLLHTSHPHPRLDTVLLPQMRTQNLQKTASRKARFGRDTTIGKPLVYTPPASRAPRRGSGGGGGTSASGADSGSLPRPNGLSTTRESGSGSAYEHGTGGVSLHGAGAYGDGSAGNGDDGGGADDVFSPVDAQALAPRRAYLEARANDMHSIQSHIVELGQIFNRLGLMVSAQAELVQRLEDNADSSLSSVEAGTAQLTRRLATVSSNKRLALSIFAILVVFAIFFSVFLA